MTCTSGEKSAAIRSKPLTRKMVLWGAIPIMLANAAAPIVGLVDTWVIGNYVGREALAGIGLGVVIFGIFYWGFGFLRMSTAGLSAQADGADDGLAVQAHLFRAIPMGFAIGIIIFVCQDFLIDVLMQFFPAEMAVDTGARTYLKARLWGLPATLASIALMGWFIGLARPARALYMQIVLNLINAPLSVLFVVKYGWGLHGVGISVVNALSTKLIVQVKKDGKIHQMEFADGERKSKLRTVGTCNKRDTGTSIHFWPDARYFDNVKFAVAQLTHTLRAKAVLCSGLAVSFTDEGPVAKGILTYSLVVGDVEDDRRHAQVDLRTQRRPPKSDPRAVR